MTELQTEYKVASSALVVVDDNQAQQLAAQIDSTQRAARWPEQLNADQRMLLAQTALMMGLNPLMGELIIYQGKPLITKSGLLRVAHEQGLDGVDPRPLNERERSDYQIPDYEFAYRCEVWRKGAMHPFVAVGRASKDNVRVTTKQGDAAPIAKWLREMAETRAINRALRLAFSVPLMSREEADEEWEQQQPALPPAEVAFKIAKKAVLEALQGQYGTNAGSAANKALEAAGLPRIGGWSELTTMEQISAMYAWLDQQAGVVEGEAVEVEVLPAETEAAPVESLPVEEAEDTFANWDIAKQRGYLQKQYCLKFMAGKTTMKGMKQATIDNILKDALHRMNMVLITEKLGSAKSFDELTPEQAQVAYDYLQRGGGLPPTAVQP